MSQLAVADYAVILIILALFAGVGLYFRFTGGRQKTTQEFLMADKNMGIFPVSFSLMATITSAITMLGFPSETYLYGAEITGTEFFYPIGTLIVAYCMVPVYFDTEVNTIYQYLEKRFGKIMKIVTSSFYSLQMLLYLPVVIYAPSLALSTVTGFSVWTSVISMTALCTLYSSMGGLKAVLWTDVFQAFIMFMTTSLLIIKGSLDYGGFSKMIATATDGHRLDMFNFDPTIRATFWNSVVYGISNSLILTGITYSMVQRLISCGNVKTAQRSLLCCIPLCFIFKQSSYFLGIVMYSYFHDCDPVQDKEQNITSVDQLVPHFALILFEYLPGVPGLCVAGIFSAALSTMSSVLNSLVAVTVEDYIKPHRVGRKLKDSTAAFLAKIIAVCYGILSICMVFVIANAKGLMEVTVIVLGIIGGPTLGVFVLGMFTKTANEQGTLFGLLMGFIVSAWLGFGSMYYKYKFPPLPLSIENCSFHANDSFYESIYSVNSSLHTDFTSLTNITEYTQETERYISPLYKISFMWLPVFGFVITALAGYFASFILRLVVKEKKVDPRQLSPIIRKWFTTKTKCRDDTQ